MSKRIKSFLISLGSFALASFTALIFTPQWAEFITWVGNTAQSKLLGWGVPAVLIVVFGMFISEIWRQLINKYIASQQGDRTIATASRNGADMY